MSPFRSFSFYRYISILIFSLSLLPSMKAYTAPISLETTVLGEPRQAITESRIIDGKDYLSLTSISNQFGGAYTILPNRVRLDLMGSTAWLGINDNRVNALSIFSLENPVLKIEQEIWMAQTDIQEFFTKSFRMDVLITETFNTPVIENPTINTTEDPPANLQSILPLTAPPLTRTIQSIIIDPGHGGYDLGLEGTAGTLEKNITLKIASYLQEILRQNTTLPISMTRSQDIDLTEHQRLKAGLESNADLMISIHVAGSFSPNVNGYTLFYPHKKDGTGTSQFTTHKNNIDSQYYAKIIAHSIGLETESVLRGIHPSTHTLFKHDAMSCVLVEIGHITNPSEETMMKMDEYQKKIAQGIAKGILAIVKHQQIKSPSLTPNQSELQ